MELLLKIWKGIKLIEKIFLILTFLSVIMVFIFRYGGSINVLVFGFILSILYFPLGFYFLGKPSADRSRIPSIALGFVYSVGLVTLLFGTLSFKGYMLPLCIFSFVLLISLVFLLPELKSKKYDSLYIKSQLFRISYVVLNNLIVLLFYLIR